MNPNCPNCGEELRVGREMYLRNVCPYYYCDAATPENKDCKFIYPPVSWRARFGSEESLAKDFGMTYNLNYQI